MDGIHKDAANTLIDAGFGAFRLQDNSKLPATPHGHKDAVYGTAAKELVDKALSERGNYGLRPPETCFVLDVDGEDAFDNIQNSNWADEVDWTGLCTLTVREGGRHFFFRSDVEIRQVNGKTKPSKLFMGYGDQVDTRTHKGYVVGPGSRIGNALYGVTGAFRVPAWPELLTGRLNGADAAPKAVNGASKGSRHSQILRAVAKKQSEATFKTLKELTDWAITYNLTEVSPPKDESEVRSIASWVHRTDLKVVKKSSYYEDLEQIAGHLVQVEPEACRLLMLKRHGDHLIDGPDGHPLFFRALDSEEPDTYDPEGRWEICHMAILNTQARKDMLYGRELMRDGKKRVPNITGSLLRDGIKFYFDNSNAVQLTKTPPGEGATSLPWDQGNGLVPFPDGRVFDLDEGEYRHQRKHDLISKVLPISPKDRPTPRWDRFLLESAAGIPEWDIYMRDLLASCLIRRQCQAIHMFVGEGANGKGVFIELAQRLLGPLATQIGPEWRSDGAHPAWKMELEGRGLAFIDEGTERFGEQWNTAVMRELSGGGTLTSRRMRGDSRTFKQTANLVIVMNDLPSMAPIRSLRDRIRIVPWNNWVDRTGKNKDRAADPYLIDALEDEGPGILADLLRRAETISREGFNSVPTWMSEHNRVAWKAMSRSFAFCDERLEESVGNFIARKDMLSAYKEWAEDQGIDERNRVSANRLYREVAQIGYEEVKRTGIRGFRNVRLKAYESYGEEAEAF